MTDEDFSGSPIYRAKIALPDGLYDVDVISHAGEFWLVPEWLDNQAEGWSMPARIIRMMSVPHQKTLGGPFGDFLVLNNALPKAVLDGHVQFGPAGMIEVVEAPGIRFAYVEH